MELKETAVNDLRRGNKAQPLPKLGKVPEAADKNTTDEVLTLEVEVTPRLKTSTGYCPHLAGSLSSLALPWNT